MAAGACSGRLMVWVLNSVKPERGESAVVKKGVQVLRRIRWAGKGVKSEAVRVMSEWRVDLMMLE